MAYGCAPSPRGVAGDDGLVGLRFSCEWYFPFGLRLKRLTGEKTESGMGKPELEIFFLSGEGAGGVVVLVLVRAAFGVIGSVWCSYFTQQEVLELLSLPLIQLSKNSISTAATTLTFSPQKQRLSPL